MQPLAPGEIDRMLVRRLEIVAGLDEPRAKRAIARFFSTLLPCGATIVAARPRRCAAKAMLCP